jgi:hemolysin activation/secretion protein
MSISRHAWAVPTQLPYKFSWLLQADGLYSPKRLIQSEQFTIGGRGQFAGSMREPSLAIRASSHEMNSVHLPSVSENSTRHRAQLQFLGFFDFGRFYIKDPIAQESYNGSIASCGGGLRLTLGKNLTLRADYGIQVLGKTAFDIPRPDLRSGHSRAHIGAVLSY